MSLEEKMEADARSIYVGNVSWGGDRRTDTPLGAQAPPPRPRPNSILCVRPPPHTPPQVDYGATAEELEAHFHGCGSVNRVTILCDKYSGHPKG